MDIRNGQLLAQCTNRDCQQVDRPIAIGVVKLTQGVVSVPTPYCEACVYEGRQPIEMMFVNWPPDTGHTESGQARPAHYGPGRI